MSKRTIGILVLLAVVGFYSFGTGFAFFFRLLYVILALLAIGLVWAWLNLRGLEVSLTRAMNRGQVGEYLEAQVKIINGSRLPKSWLEVSELSDLPGHAGGRGLALAPGQSRSWKTRIYLERRGMYHVGQLQVVSQDPFGLFRMRRRFLDSQPCIVYPATQPLPDVDPRLAALPGGSRLTRRAGHITTDIASVRQYSDGDSLRRIHWPYTARMNTLMVKEFDIGMSAEAWLLLDMEESVHSGEGTESTEELAVTVAASLVSWLLDLSLLVGLATAGDQTSVVRPDRGSGQQQRLMETLASIRAHGGTSLKRFIYDLEPHLSRLNTLTIITPSLATEWLPGVDDLRRRGVKVSVVFIDVESFGGPRETARSHEAFFMNDLPAFLVKKGQPLNLALRLPMQGGMAPVQGEVT